MKSCKNILTQYFFLAILCYSGEGVEQYRKKTVRKKKVTHIYSLTIKCNFKKISCNKGASLDLVPLKVGVFNFMLLRSQVPLKVMTSLATSFNSLSLFFHICIFSKSSSSSPKCSSCCILGFQLLSSLSPHSRYSTI